MTSEFDVTDVLQDGTHTVAVLVMRWCDGSYLEDQDKFRMRGIFRDVYILKRPEQAIRDVYKRQLHNTSFTDSGVAICIRQVEDLAFLKHGILPAGKMCIRDSAGCFF